MWCVPTWPDCGARKGTRKRCNFQEKSLSWQRMCRNLIALRDGLSPGVTPGVTAADKDWERKSPEHLLTAQGHMGSTETVKQHPPLFPCVQAVGKLS